MQIIADENIPLLKEYFSVFGDVVAVNGRNMTAAQLAAAEVLLVRSVTPVNAELLSGAPVGFVGTCTIGTDHIDTGYLQQNHIPYASAPGCNAGGVVQYVLTALTQLRPNWRDLTIGIIGCGNVGGRLYRSLKRLGINCIGYDPFLKSSSDLRLAAFDDVLKADVICMHTPLTRQGPHPTEHMIDREVLSRLQPGCLLLNAGRGGAIDNTALLEHLNSGVDIEVVLDVWEKEPSINAELARKVAIATPHIAGYSNEGRTNGSAMICRELAMFLGWDAARIDRHLAAVAATIPGNNNVLAVESLEDALSQTYDLRGDHQRLMDAVNGPNPLGPAFDGLRKHYPERHEPLWFRVAATGNDQNRAMQSQLAAVGFQVVEES